MHRLPTRRYQITWVSRHSRTVKAKQVVSSYCAILRDISIRVRALLDFSLQTIPIFWMKFDAGSIEILLALGWVELNPSCLVLVPLIMYMDSFAKR